MKFVGADATIPIRDFKCSTLRHVAKVFAKSVISQKRLDVRKKRKRQV